MAKKFFVYSTLTASVRYAASVPGGAEMPVPTEGVLIEGGSNVANKNLITPRGVVTTVSADQLERLNADPVFALHKENGFITVSEHKEDPEKVVSGDLQTRDASAPLTPEDYTADKANAPKVGDADVETSAAKSSRKA